MLDKIFNRCILYTVWWLTTITMKLYTILPLIVIFSIDHPKLTVISNVSISEDGNQSVVFTCTASGNPDSTTFLPWTHMYGTTVVRELAGTNNSTHSTLRMSSLRYQDMGIYICNGTNGIGRNGSMYSFHWTKLDVHGNYSDRFWQRQALFQLCHGTGHQESNPDLWRGQPTLTPPKCTKRNTVGRISPADNMKC